MLHSFQLTDSTLKPLHIWQKHINELTSKNSNKQVGFFSKKGQLR